MPNVAQLTQEVIERFKAAPSVRGIVEVSESDASRILAVLEAAQRWATAFDATGNALTMEQERWARAEQFMARDALLGLISVEAKE